MNTIIKIHQSVSPVLEKYDLTCGSPYSDGFCISWGKKVMVHFIVSLINDIIELKIQVNIYKDLSSYNEYNPNIVYKYQCSSIDDLIKKIINIRKTYNDTHNP